MGRVHWGGARRVRDRVRQLRRHGARARMAVVCQPCTALALWLWLWGRFLPRYNARSSTVVLGRRRVARGLWSLLAGGRDRAHHPRLLAAPQIPQHMAERVLCRRCIVGGRRVPGGTHGRSIIASLGVREREAGRCSWHGPGYVCMLYVHSIVFDEPAVQRIREGEHAALLRRARPGQYVSR
jgi:hypothetical protein